MREGTSWLRRGFSRFVVTAVVLAGVSVLAMASPAVGAETTTATVVVEASTPILASGVVVDGVTNDVVVTASGEWNIGGTHFLGDAFGPEGSPNTEYRETCMLVTDVPFGTLVGTLDGGETWFAIGAGPTTVTGAGDLGLAANDCMGPNGIGDWRYYTDHAGSVTVTITSTPRPPTSASQCKNGGWRSFGIFRNQGDCVSFVATGGRNAPAG